MGKHKGGEAQADEEKGREMHCELECLLADAMICRYILKSGAIYGSIIMKL